MVLKNEEILPTKNADLSRHCLTCRRRKSVGGNARKLPEAKAFLVKIVPTDQPGIPIPPKL